MRFRSQPLRGPLDFVLVCCVAMIFVLLFLVAVSLAVNFANWRWMFWPTWLAVRVSVLTGLVWGTAIFVKDQYHA